MGDLCIAVWPGFFFYFTCLAWLLLEPCPEYMSCPLSMIPLYLGTLQNAVNRHSEEESPNCCMMFLIIPIDKPPWRELLGAADDTVRIASLGAR